MIFENTGKKSWNELDDNTKGLLLLAYYEGKTIQEWCEDEGNGEYDWYDWYDDYLHPEWADGIWRIKPEPVKQVHWMNDYTPPKLVLSFDRWLPSRAMADNAAYENRIAVIRREIVDGVASYYKEDV
jgi:hypothetical protein